MTREEHFDLLSRYLDDTLRDEDVPVVEDLLRNDAEFARMLTDLSLQHSLLHRLGKTNEAAPASGLGNDESSAILRISARRRTLARTRSAGAGSWLRVAIPVAAAFLFVIIGFAVLPGDPVPPPEVTVLPDPAPKPEPAPKPAPEPRIDPRIPPAPKQAAPIATPGRDAKPPAPRVPAPSPRRIEKPAPPPPAPEKKPTPEKQTRIAVATLGDVTGSVWVTDGAGAEEGPVASGKPLVAGQGLRTGTGRARVTYADGSFILVDEATEIREFSQAKGKRAFLANGSVSAHAEKQALTTPMVITTPQADVRVLGTEFAIHVSPQVTRLSVTEGRVRLTRRSDRRTVIVPAGAYALAGAGEKLAVTRLPAAPGIVAHYRFDEGRGAVIRDQSNVGTPLDLRITKLSAVQWRPGALSVNAPVVIASAGPAAKIAQACRGSNELTVEAWIRPAAALTPAAPEPGRIMTFSTGLFDRNFCLEQGIPPSQNPRDLYNVRLRTTSTGANGFPPGFKTPGGSARPRLTHVVYVRTRAGVAIFYLDGREVARQASAGDLSTWADGFPLILADEAGGKRPWAGEYHALSIYARALPADEVSKLKAAGPR